MSQTIDVNGQSINYPETGDPNWGDEATNFAVQTSAAFGKLGLASGTSVDIAQTLDVTGNTTLDANLSVAGTTSLTGDVTITNNLTVTGIVNVDSGVLYVDPVYNRVGINDTTPSEALDVTGNALISGTLGITGATSLSSTLAVTGDVSVNTNKFNITASSGNTTIAGTLGVTGDVAINTNKFNVTASSGNTTIAGTLGVTGNTTVDGVIYADDNTTANTPVISFTGDTDTGLGRSAADTLDLITNGNSRFRIESTGQIKAVIPSGVTNYNGYLCRAWAIFPGTSGGSLTEGGNVSSILRTATGSYTVTFSNNLPDTNYAVFINGSPNNRFYMNGTKSVGSFTFIVNSGSTPGTLADQTNLDIMVIR